MTGLAALFGDRIFSATDVAHGKPAPDLFLYAAEQCGTPAAQSIVIEDSPTGVIAAGRAGMAAIGFAGGRHADSRLAEALAGAGAWTVLGKMAELPAAIERLRAGQSPLRDSGAARRERTS